MMTMKQARKMFANRTTIRAAAKALGAQLPDGTHETVKLPGLSLHAQGLASSLAAEERDWAALRELAEARDTGRFDILTPSVPNCSDDAPTVRAPRVYK